ncbi:MAG: hypothetical protein R3305_08865, partial [Gammaproteobacteria bacterium]|nr:hypothetical protein [Gammaproteobacteria bacterium]
LTSRFGYWQAQSSPISLDTGGGQNAITETFESDNDQRDMSAEYRRPFAGSGSLMIAFVDAEQNQESENSLTEDGNLRSSISNRESGETAARLLITQPLNERLTIRTEATTAFNFFEGGFQLFENGVELPVANSDNRVEEDRRSVEASVDWNLSEKWTFSSSVGIESYEITSRVASSGTQTDPKGDLSLSFRPAARTTFSLESSRSIGQLSFNQFLASSSLSSEIVTAGAAALEPERQWTHAAIYDRRFGDAGVMRFELQRQIVDNPVNSVALSDSITVAQNTSEEQIDRIRARIEFPFERFGREDFVLSVQGNIAQSNTIDPVTGESREVSGVQTRDWGLDFRRDPGDGNLAWGASIRDREDGDDFSVRRTGSREESSDWDAFVEWEPIRGLKLRTQVQGPTTSVRTSRFFPAVRSPGLDPSFIATTRTEQDSSASFTVEWRRREHFEIRASLSSRPRIRSTETLTPFGETVGSIQTTEFAETPRATLRFRFYR